MGIKSRQVTTFPQPFDTESPYILNEFTPSARTLSDANKGICDDDISSSKIAARLGKSVFVGDVGVGKTSIINRFCKGVFRSNYYATIGVDYEIERFWILNVPFNLQIWDTAGQERFKCIAASYYRNSNAIVTVFDASNLETLSTCQRWMDDAVGANGTMPIKFLVATKMDLVAESHKEKIHVMGKRMAKLMEAEYIAVSSKTGENVENLFRRIACLCLEISLGSEAKEKILTEKYLASHRESRGSRVRLSAESGSISQRNKCSSCKR